jgi:soluble lytic murein transglycosylase-like protein
MRFSKPLLIAGVLLAAQLSALGAEIAVLRNGRTLSHLRREQMGEITRLYTNEGYIDVPTEQIASFEVEETPPSEPANMVAASPGQEPQPVSHHPAQSLPALAGDRVDLDALVREAGSRRQIDPDFINSVIKAESNFHPRAVSRKGAQGLMQLMPATAAKLGVRDPFDPKANVEAGTAYLSDLLDLYHDDPIKALAAYNAGPQRVEQYHGVPPYRETRAYIARIVRDFNAKKKAQRMASQNASSKASNKTGIAKKTGNTGKAQQASINGSRVPAGAE